MRAQNSCLNVIAPIMLRLRSFFYRNTTTALQVAAARGVAITAAQQAGLPLYEYTPMQIKQSVTGDGHADKLQMQTMVKLLLKLQKIPKPDDAADAVYQVRWQSDKKQG